MRRKFKFSVGEYYHIYNRGTDKRVVFTSTRDYNRFMVLLHLCNSKLPIDVSYLLRGRDYYMTGGRFFSELMGIEIGDRLVDIGSYCLLPNHFHLLVHERKENGISLFMKKLLTAYSMYFNNKYQRTGRLFEGTFMAKHANKDKYLKYLFSYIHLNPVKIVDKDWEEKGILNRTEAKNYLADYRYSSYLDYIGRDRPEKKILSSFAFPEYFGTYKEFDNFIDEWISFV